MMNYNLNFITYQLISMFFFQVRIYLNFGVRNLKIIGIIYKVKIRPSNNRIRADVNYLQGNNIRQDRCQLFLQVPAWYY